MWISVTRNLNEDEDVKTTVSYQYISRKHSSFFRCLKLANTILVHPLSLLTLACSIDTIKEFGLFDKTSFELILGCVDATKRALMYSIADGYIYGSVNYSIGCLFLLPVWTLLWVVNVSWAEQLDIPPPSPCDEDSNHQPENTPEKEEGVKNNIDDENVEKTKKDD